MKEKIVQLSDYEYNQLYNKANLNEQQIQELAEKFYQERGVFKIEIKMGIQEKYNGDVEYYTSVFSYENGVDYLNHTLVPEKWRRKIERMIENNCKETFRREFGDAIKFKENYVDALERFILLRRIFYAIAFSGWGVAAALLVKLFS